MMRFGLVAVLVLMSLRGWGQEVLWEKSLGWASVDELTDVLALPDSGYVACGTSYTFGAVDVIGGSSYYAVCILKILPNGDTAWFKPVLPAGYEARLCQGDSEGFFMVATRAFEPPANYVDQLFLFKIDYEGNVIFQRPIGTVSSSAKKIMRTHSGSIVTTGWATALPGSGNTTDMFVARIDTSGLIYFFERYNDNRRTYGNWIEEMPNGHYLASGAAGSRIWAVEIDTNGAEVQRQTMYQNASHIVYDDEAWVNQGPGGTFVATGYANGSGYLGCYTGLSISARVWGGERAISYLPPHVNQDSSMVLYTSWSTTQTFAKLRADSSRVWSTSLSSRLGADLIRVFALAYSPDSSAVAAGYARFTSAQGEDFYLCRIANVGVPYHSGPTAVKARYKGLPQVIAYPNPTAGRLTVHTRSKLALTVSTLSGKQVLQAKPDLSGTTLIDLSGLPSGMYILRQGQSCLKLVRE